MKPQAIKHAKPAAIRIGAVSYLNTKPLIATLEKRLELGSRLSLDLPSQLAEQLARRKLDIGLIPAIEFFRGPQPIETQDGSSNEYRMISNACIACQGNVRSVRLFFRVPPYRVTSIAIDEGSRTSVALAAILLDKRFGIRPKMVPLPLAANPDSVASDAVLVIGDRAMHPEKFKSFTENWDLGNEWYEATCLPFVFAMWVGRLSVASPTLARQLELARDEGVQLIEQLSELYASQYALSVAECVEYLSVHLRFTMNRDEIQGLKKFYEMALNIGHIPSSPSPIWPTISSLTSPHLITT